MKRLEPGIASEELTCLLRDGAAGGLSDGELLRRFAGSRERDGEMAFAVLVARHGPMVLSICRRILRDRSEIDDAFQATFLVLARRAGGIRLGGSLAPWLHGVSRRVALRFRSVAARRAAVLRQDAEMDSVPDRYWSWLPEIERRLDLKEALDALPGVFRDALILCYFEGLTHEEAAEKLGCPVGTIRSRLARGRALLRDRLDSSGFRLLPSDADTADPGRRGPTPSMLAPSLIHSTARAAARLAAGHPMAGVVPARVAEVATGVVTAMYRTKFAAMALVATIVAVTGWGAWAGPSAPGQDASGRSPQATDRPKNTKRVVPAGKKSEARPAPDRPADFPAFVVETEPKLGDPDVDPSKVKEIRVTFSKPMMDKTWSWTSGNVYAFPEDAGPIHYLADMRTCVMPAKLAPGKTYVIGINGGRFNNFKDKDGKPSLPYTIAFRTRAAQ
jgi:RNA polymerase sigma factor (sigma-70 family)